MAEEKKDRGLEKGLTSYGDRQFSLFLVDHHAAFGAVDDPESDVADDQCPAQPPVFQEAPIGRCQKDVGTQPLGADRFSDSSVHSG